MRAARFPLDLHFGESNGDQDSDVRKGGQQFDDRKPASTASPGRRASTLIYYFAQGHDLAI
jgi:hypothetical protein